MKLKGKYLVEDEKAIMFETKRFYYIEHKFRNECVRIPIEKFQNGWTLLENFHVWNQR